MIGHDEHHQERPSKTWIWIFGGAFIAIAGYFLVVEHRQHLFAALPWLLVLACPLMHIFMHGKHGGHGGADSGKNEPHQH